MHEKKFYDKLLKKFFSQKKSPTKFVGFTFPFHLVKFKTQKGEKNEITKKNLKMKLTFCFSQKIFFPAKKNFFDKKFFIGEVFYFVSNIFSSYLQQPQPPPR